MARIILYGIANCDTVKRARAWLAARGAEHDFHDFKKAGVPAQGLMLAQPSVIKRPVVQWPDGRITAGFDADSWERRLRPSGAPL
jgi:arsenate reductase-like glutaredoxin family protein